MPIALGAALTLCVGAFAAAREGFASAAALLTLAGVLIGAWIVLEEKDD